MKNQYTGDIGDYGKLGLLRQLADAGFRIGVNWYLTPDETEKKGDGKFISYLKDVSFRGCDPQLWEQLGAIIKSGKREVQSLQRAEILTAAFYGDPMAFSGATGPERAQERRCWHRGAMAALRGCDLIFADPDNGLMVPSAERGRKSVKYVLTEELQDYYASGAGVIYYQHKARCGDGVYTARNAALIAAGGFENARGFGLKFSTTSQRYYFFLVHPEQEEKIRAVLGAMLKTDWAEHFSFLE